MYLLFYSDVNTYLFFAVIVLLNDVYFRRGGIQIFVTSICKSKYIEFGHSAYKNYAFVSRSRNIASQVFGSKISTEKWPNGELWNNLAENF